MRSEALVLLAWLATAAAETPAPKGACAEGDGSCPASAAPAGPKGSVLLQSRHSSKKGQAVIDDEAAQVPPLPESTLAPAPAPAPEPRLEPEPEGAASLPIPPEVADQIARMKPRHGSHGVSVVQDAVATATAEETLEEIPLAKADLSKSISATDLAYVWDLDSNSWGGAVSLVVDLGKFHKVDMLRADWRVCACELAGSLKLQSSQDGITYETWDEPMFRAWGDHVTLDHPTGGIVARYLKVFVTTISSVQYVAFWDLKLFGEARPRAPNAYGWYQSYLAGPTTGLGGTEIMHLVGYKGKLFAGTGYWMSTAAWRPAEVVRLDCPFCDWIVETAIGPWAGRTESLEALTWTTDGTGSPLPGGPVEQLVAAYYMNYLGEGRCYFVARLEYLDPPLWKSDVYYQKTPFADKYFSARFLMLYQDSVTNVDHLFATTGVDGITTGTYYELRTTNVLWTNQIEAGSGGLPARPLGMVELDRKLYFTAAAKIYRRTDGINPSWSPVFDMATVDPTTTVDEAVGGIRGITVIPDTRSSTGNSLLFAWTPNEASKGCLIRLDVLGDTFTSEQEICIQDAERNYLGTNVHGLDPLATYTLANYNFAMEATHSDGSKVHLIGFEILLWDYTAREFPVDPYQLYNHYGHIMSFYAGSGYVVRRATGTYEVREPGGPRYDPQDVHPKLVATRALVPSPFSGDTAVYMGGYDCNHYPSLDTAWVMRGENWGVFEGQVPCQKELGCGHVAGLTFQTYGCDVCSGFEFYAQDIAYWTGTPPQAVACQMVLDWLNGPGTDYCEVSKDWAFTQNCCAHRGCNFCRATNKQFMATNLAGLTGTGEPYNCQVALDYTNSGAVTCEQGTSWWSGTCCV